MITVNTFFSELLFLKIYFLFFLESMLLFNIVPRVHIKAIRKEYKIKVIKNGKEERRAS